MLRHAFIFQRMLGVALSLLFSLRRYVLLVSIALAAAYTMPAGDQAAARITEITSLPDQDIQLKLFLPVGHLWRLETSLNLLEWRPWLTVLGAGAQTQVDSAAPYHKSRFYRGIQLDPASTIVGDNLSAQTGDVTIHDGRY
jgi:hypothetical protein